MVSVRTIYDRNPHYFLGNRKILDYFFNRLDGSEVFQA